MHGACAGRFEIVSCCVACVAEIDDSNEESTVLCIEGAQAGGAMSDNEPRATGIMTILWMLS
jgi:hypothetical protein